MKKLYTILCIFCLLPATYYASVNADTIIEGIFYLDGSPVSIEVKDGLIVRLNRISELSNPDHANLIIAPGLIDHQVNGYMGHSFTGNDLDLEKVRLITTTLWANGITTYIPTLTTNSSEVLFRNFEIMGEAIKDPQLSMSIPGFHLEGPYISPVEGYRGSHNEKWIRKPDWEEFQKMQKASGGKILEVSIAPELDGAIEFIENCRRDNIVVALAHHNGSADIIKKAVDAGAVVSTHLGNGCANNIHRHLNPLWPQLAEDRLIASIIVDGFHLTPDEVQTFYKVKGPERTIIVSDVSRLGGMPAGTYGNVIVTPEGMISLPSQKVLAGASFLITVGLGNVMRFTNCSLADAVHMASRNPARLLHLDDRGEITPGKRADLVLFSINEHQIKVHKTYVSGALVYEAE